MRTRRTDDGGGPEAPSPEAPSGEEPPAYLAGLPEERIVDVDVREDLRAGREPFRRIMQARQELAPGAVLRVRAIFEPAPLYGVMAKTGLDHWTERIAPDDWRIWFHPPREEMEAARAPGRGSEDRAPPREEPGGRPGSDPTPEERAGAREGEATFGRPGDEAVVLDVRGLEPPEPLVRTLTALEELPAGKTLVQINVREPVFLFPRLEERGFGWEVRHQRDEGIVRVFIRREAGGG